jgi:transcriptional regulator with XRE-family HTH domain
MANMNHEAARQFGTYIKGLREARKLSIRGLASEANIDSGALTRLEHGKVRAPQPDTLKALSKSLGAPLSDMFAMAGYVVPHDLPSLVPYLRARYSHLPDEALAAAHAYLCRLVSECGLDPERA